MEASLRGVKVRGYTPKEHDIRELEERQERLMRNSLERDQKKIDQGPVRKEQDQDQSRVQENNREQRQNPEERRENTKKAFRGKLLEHGSAPYEFDKKNEDSYYVKIENRKGVRTIWGVDLERAVNQSGAEVGSKRMELKGKKSCR
jgi:putative DNA primase/helicase